MAWFVATTAISAALLHLPGTRRAVWQLAACWAIAACAIAESTLHARTLGLPAAT